MKRKLSLVLVLVLFLSGTAHAKNFDTKAFWKQEANLIGLLGNVDVWNYSKDRLNSKKQSEAIMFLPSHTMPDYTTIIFWFHGCNGYSKRTFKTRLIPQLKKLQDRNESYAIVVPELAWSQNTTTRCSRLATSFRKPGKLVSFVDNSIDRINSVFQRAGKEIMVGPRIVFVGHSGGGSVFKASAISGDLCRIKPDMVVWSDSTYGRWFTVAWNKCLSSGETDTVVLVRKWTKTWRSFNRFLKGRSKLSEFLDVRYFRGKFYHSVIGDNALDLADVFQEGC